MAQNMNLSFIEGPLWSKLYNLQCKIIKCVTKRIFILKFCHCASGHMSTIWVSFPVKQEMSLKSKLPVFFFSLISHLFQLICFICGRRRGQKPGRIGGGVCEVGKERTEVRVLKGWEVGEIQRMYATVLNWKMARSGEWKVWEVEGLEFPPPPWLLVITSKVKIYCKTYWL